MREDPSNDNLNEGTETTMRATWPKLYTYAGADGHALTIGVHDNGAITWRIDGGADVESLTADEMRKLADLADAQKRTG